MAGVGVFAYLSVRAIVATAIVTYALGWVITHRSKRLRVAGLIVLIAVSLFDARDIQPQNDYSLHTAFPLWVHMLVNLPFVGAVVLGRLFYLKKTGQIRGS